VCEGDRIISPNGLSCIDTSDFVNCQDEGPEDWSTDEEGNFYCTECEEGWFWDGTSQGCTSECSEVFDEQCSECSIEGCSECEGGSMPSPYGEACVHRIAHCALVPLEDQPGELPYDTWWIIDEDGDRI